MLEPAVTDSCKLHMPSDTVAPAPILSLDLHKSKKTLGMHDCPAGENKSHLEQTRDKVNAWIDNMINGHLSSSMGWIAYNF